MGVPSSAATGAPAGAGGAAGNGGLEGASGSAGGATTNRGPCAPRRGGGGGSCGGNPMGRHLDFSAVLLILLWLQHARPSRYRCAGL